MVTAIRFFRRVPGSGQVLILGGASLTRDLGWRFIPSVSSRQPSRRFYPTWEACLPRWVGYPGYCESVVTAEDWKRVS
jgi:hypothetical protein